MGDLSEIPTQIRAEVEAALGYSAIGSEEAGMTWLRDLVFARIISVFPDPNVEGRQRIADKPFPQKLYDVIDALDYGQDPQRVDVTIGEEASPADCQEAVQWSAEGGGGICRSNEGGLRANGQFSGDHPGRRFADIRQRICGGFHIGRFPQIRHFEGEIELHGFLL